MPKYLNLQINEPCHEDWNIMTPNEQGRFCGSCAKTVVDFSGMTNTQILNYFNSNTGNTCGRFYEDQLNAPIAIPRKEIPWLKYFFTITLPAFLFSAKANAQKNTVVAKVEKSSVKNKPDSTIKNLFSFMGGYTIYDSSSIPDKKLVMRSYWNHADEFFKPKSNPNLKEELLKEVIVISKPCKKRSILSGMVSTFQYSDTILNNTNILTSIFLKKNIEAESKLFISPNPVPTNSTLNISFSKDMLGEIVLEIFTANGDLVKKENRIFNDKTKSTFINTNNLPFGFYICVAINIITNEKLSKEFLVK